MHFFEYRLPGRLDEARGAAAEFVGVDAADFAFVRNVTHAANAVLRSLSFEPGDELLTTDHAYGACRNLLEFVAKRSGATVRIARVPIGSATDVLPAIDAAVTPKTRLALIDHVTSPTGLLFPIADIVSRLDARGVPTLVDGAHAPGMFKLDIAAIAPAYYVANFHKWACAPKGAGMLYVRRDLQKQIHPAIISQGYAIPTTRAFEVSLGVRLDRHRRCNPRGYACRGRSTQSQQCSPAVGTRSTVTIVPRSSRALPHSKPSLASRAATRA